MGPDIRVVVARPGRAYDWLIDQGLRAVALDYWRREKRNTSLIGVEFMKSLNGQGAVGHFYFTHENYGVAMMFKLTFG